MCNLGSGVGNLTGQPTVDNTIQQQLLAEAQAARQREEARQARITSGIQTINNTFAPFDDNFYKGRKTAFLDYYQPQLDDQFKDARDKLTYAFSRAGTLNSTMAADEAAKLGKKYTLQLGSLVNQADGDANGLRSQIENDKSSIIGQLNSTGDAQAASNDALARTKVLAQSAPAYSPLGDIFSGVGDAIGNYANANRNRQLYSAYFGPSGSSARTVV